MVEYGLDDGRQDQMVWAKDDGPFGGKRLRGGGGQDRRVTMGACVWVVPVIFSQAFMVESVQGWGLAWMWLRSAHMRAFRSVWRLCRRARGNPFQAALGKAPPGGSGLPARCSHNPDRLRDRGGPARCTLTNCPSARCLA